MSIKSLRNQLLAAIAMVLVATIALGSSTYAWFASNGKVSATGMQVQAVAEGGIEIAWMTPNETGTDANGNATYKALTDADYSTTAKSKNALASLNPTSTANATAWYHARAEQVTATNAKSNTYKVVTPKIGTDGVAIMTGAGELNGSYYLYNQFMVRSTSAQTTAKNLKIAGVTVSNSDQALNKAIRVAVVTTNSTTIFAPAYDSDTSYNIWNGQVFAEDKTITQADLSTAVAAKSGADVYDTGITSLDHAGTLVKVYIYFEGEDSNLFSNNLKDTMDGLTITVDFSADVNDNA